MNVRSYQLVGAWLILTASTTVCLLFPVDAEAANGLPFTAAAFPGTFKTNDPGTNTGCANANVLSGTCACAGHTPPALSLRVLGDGQGVWGGWSHFCSNGTSLAESEFGGAYQVDDPVPGSLGCRQPNPSTGACSCPAGTMGVPVRVLSDTWTGLIGSSVTVCQRVSAAPSVFGGTYQVDDPGGYGCRSANPNTGSCSCPAGFIAQPNRVLVDGPRGSNFFTCVRPLTQVQICSGHFASPAGDADATHTIQSCIDAAANQSPPVLEIPAGSYKIGYALQLPSNVTLRTLGTQGNPARCLSDMSCAALLASPSFYSIDGVVQATYKVGVKIDHLVIDGNRSFRMFSANADQCRAGQNVYGFNARFRQCESCEFTQSGSIGALCGTGMEWLGDNANIRNSIFQGNGDSNVFADGLTLLQSNGAQVIGNWFLENTDINFIYGGGNYSTIRNNFVQSVQPARFAFAGMMLDNFGGATSGSFWGTQVFDNVVDCQRCAFALNIGPRPWYPGTIYGGSVFSNVISGGHITVNVDGSGADPSSGVLISNNVIGPYVNHWINCMSPTEFNLSPQSYLHPGSGNQPTTYQDTGGCHK